MTHVEKMRFQAALKTLRGTGPLHYGRFTVDARGVWCRRGGPGGGRDRVRAHEQCAKSGPEARCCLNVKN